MKSTLVACLGMAGLIAGRLGLGPPTVFAASSASESPRAAVFSNVWSEANLALTREVARQLEAAGYAVQYVSAETLSRRGELVEKNFDLLALPNARELPADCAPALEDFLKAGGDLLALGLPAWQSPFYKVNGRWLSRSQYEQAIAGQRPQHSIETFDRADLSQWSRASNESASRTRYELVPAEGGQALHVVIENLTGWETFLSPRWTQPFPAGHLLTCFRARGGPRTHQLSLEWTEEDGSRWIATVDLTSDWKNYALPPEAFKAWQPPAGRGGKDDRLNVRKAVRCTVGLAISHTALAGARHEYWFDNLGTAPHPFGEVALPASPTFPRLESFSPEYLFFPITTPVRLSTPFVGQASRLSQALEAPSESSSEVGKVGCVVPSAPSVANSTEESAGWGQPALPILATGPTPVLRYGIHPRPRGVGFDQGRPWRWQPLLEARSDDGDYRGALAALLVHTQPPFRGGIWACFTPAEPEFYRQPAMQQMLRDVAAAMKRGVFLQEGGSEFFTAFDGQAFRIGARVVNFGREAQSNLTVNLTVGPVGTDRRAVREVPPQNDRPARRSGPTSSALADDGKLMTTPFERSQIDLAPGTEKVVEKIFTPTNWPAEGLTVAASVEREGNSLDLLTHELHVWRPKPKPEFIEARDGGFWLRGQPWKAHGVNYMPSSGIGLASGQYFEHWIGRGAYDPEFIDRDLRRVKAMNLNAVSVFIHHQSLKAQHLLDFLRRCEALGLRVNQSLRPGTPMNFLWPQMKELIEYYRLAQNDTVFAYDLAWEPSHYDEAYQRQHYTTAWNTWIAKRHGSVNAAEKVWNFNSRDSKVEPRASPPPSALRVPHAQELTQDGPWRKMVADYRAFLDDLLREKYAEARRLVKSIDPQHPVSFRMQHAGDPTHNWGGLMPYDFYGLADAVDLWEPEAYGRIGDWEKVKPGHFTAAYARLCDPSKPVLWAEMGYHVWDMKSMAPHPETLKFAARYYADFYRMMTESGADGVFFWWYPGGYRLNEQSDYGIINPDGTDREVTRVIRSEGARFLQAPKPPPPNYWITVDRDRDARGLFGIYEAVKGEYWKALEEGRTPGLKWRQKPGASRE